MDVYVDSSRVNLEVQEEIRLVVGGNQFFVAVEHGFLKIWMAHISPVDEKVLQCIALRVLSGVDTKPEILTKEVSVLTGISCF